MAEEQKVKKIDISLGDIEGKAGIDYSDYNQLDTTIESAEVIDLGTPTQENILMRITTESLNGTDIRATEFIKLFRDKDGKIKYSESPNSNASKMLNFFDIKDFSELIGKKVMTLVKVKEDGKKRIGFHYG